MQKLAGMEEENWDNEGDTLIDRLSLEEIERYNEKTKIYGGIWNLVILNHGIDILQKV